MISDSSWRLVAGVAFLLIDIVHPSDTASARTMPQAARAAPGGSDTLHDPPSSTDDIGLTGSIGTYRVGAHLTVRSHRTIVAGHYYYASRLVDIPLIATNSGETFVLREPGGGVFRLHLETNGRSAPRFLDFATATALAGTWTRHDRVLPVRLVFDLVGGARGNERYASVTASTPAAFETKVRTFLGGVIAGNRQQAASAVSFPLTVNGADPLVVRDRAQLFARWDRIFSPCMVAALREAMPHEMFVRNGLAMVADGTAWFDAHGATRLNPPRCAKPEATRTAR